MSTRSASPGWAPLSPSSEAGPSRHNAGPIELSWEAWPPTPGDGFTALPGRSPALFEGGSGVALPSPSIEGLTQHPLHRIDSPPGATEHSYAQVLSDVTRPNLTRLTSDLERRAGSSRGNESEEGSQRGSLDVLRMTSAEVEVLVHMVGTCQRIETHG
jgi:hypothetical protein